MKKQFLALGLAVTLAFSGSMTVNAEQVQDTQVTYETQEEDVVVFEQDGESYISESVNGVTETWNADTTLPAIDAPAWIKWDHSNRVGSISFATVDAAEGSYYFSLYRDGEQVAGRKYPSLFSGSICFSEDINESGTYVVEITALGDGETTGNSATVRSDEFVYTRPSQTLTNPTNLRWNSENPTKAEWDPVANAGGYYLSLYLDGRSKYGIISYSASYLSENLAKYITESGAYTFTVTALSGNINEIANGTESAHSGIYDATNAIAQVNSTLDDALSQAQTDANAALDTVKGLNKSNLQAAMQSDEAARNKVKQLEDAYAGQNNINVSNNVDASISGKIDTSKINVVGAALNAAAANTNMSLNFRQPETEAVIDPSQYKNAVQIDITLDGVTDSQNLTVPMTMTVPIPDGVSTSRFQIIHCHLDGTKEIINPIIDAANRTATFTITRFSTFVFANEKGTSFEDVPSDAYYAAPVAWAVQNGITNGTSDSTFSPAEDCTRGQIVTFLWRAAGSPEPSSANNPFTDVSTSSYYYKAVLWAVEKGITTGTSGNTFSPNATCTRAQAVTFLYRYAGQPSVASASNPFGDVSNGTYYYNPVLWAVNQGITTGTSTTAFSPDSYCTRGQIVTFLYRQAN